MPELSRSACLLDTQTCRVPIDRRLTELAAAQHGVVARRQLVAFGMSTTMIHDRLRRGMLLQLHRGVYAVGHRRLRSQGTRLAAVLATGPGAALSHRDAAALHGLRPSNRTRVDVTTLRRGRTQQPGIDIHRTTVLDATDVEVIEGIPVTTVARTLVDLADVLPIDRLAKTLREAEYLRVADLHEIHDVMRRTRNRPGPGHATLQAILEEHRLRGLQLTRSILEDRFLKLLETHQLPRPLTNHDVNGDEVDAFWPPRGLVVELDGYARHRDRHAFQRDRTKANALTEAGFTVLRFTHDDVVRQPEATARTLGTFLRGA